MKKILTLALGTMLALAASAGAQEPGLGEATQAGRATVSVAADRAFTDARAERSVRRAMRRHGFTDVRADCTRARRAGVADCAVTATDGLEWSGTATVRRMQHADRVEYLVRGAS